MTNPINDSQDMPQDIIDDAIASGFDKWEQSCLSGLSDLDETLAVAEYAIGESLLKFAALREARIAHERQLKPVLADDALDKLVRNAEALLAMDADGILRPHGVCGAAREIIQKFINLSKKPNVETKVDYFKLEEGASYG